MKNLNVWIKWKFPFQIPRKKYIYTFYIQYKIKHLITLNLCFFFFFLKEKRKQRERSTSFIPVGRSTHFLLFISAGGRVSVSIVVEAVEWVVSVIEHIWAGCGIQRVGLLWMSRLKPRSNSQSCYCALPPSSAQPAGSHSLWAPHPRPPSSSQPWDHLSGVSGPCSFDQPHKYVGILHSVLFF